MKYKLSKSVLIMYLEHSLSDWIVIIGYYSKFYHLSAPEKITSIATIIDCVKNAFETETYEICHLKNQTGKV